MQLNFNSWLSSLDSYAKSLYLEGCTLMFPLLDKTSKIRRPDEKSNKKRMVSFINDELENVIAIGTGLNVEFDSNGRKIILGDEGIAELFYRVRCAILHEAQMPENIIFKRQFGLFEFSLSPATSTTPLTISVPSEFCESLLLAILACPEYTSIPSEFNNRRIRFGRHEIMPSECVGNIEELRKQLIFGPNK